MMPDLNPKDIPLSITIRGDAALMVATLAEKHGIDPVEVLRMAIAKEMYYSLEQGKGSTPLILRQDGELREVVFRSPEAPLDMLNLHEYLLERLYSTEAPHEGGAL